LDAQSAAGRRTATPTLTWQQRRVLHLVALGCSTKQIAERLRVREVTVKWHVTQLLVLFNVPNRAALVHVAALGKYLRRLPMLTRE
jgi:DNA-binding NarL/FixJ family response regulator